jgi:hypothetical protein
MNQNGIELQVCADGKPVREYGHEGHLFVEGRKGSAFTLKIRNSRPERANIVVLVDGINVVTGGSELTKGYVVSGLSSYEIQGWRTSLNDVSTFVFKDKKGSYSAVTTGTAKMCGLISVTAYSEKKKEIVKERIVHHWNEVHVPYPVPVYPRPYYPPYWYGVAYSATSGDGSATYTSAGPIRESGPSGSQGSFGRLTCNAMFSHESVQSAISETTKSCGAKGEALSALSLGAAWGPQKADSVCEVEFTNELRIASMELYYTDAKGLKKLGIDTKKTPSIAKSSLPTVLGKFCQPPA